MGQFYRQLDLCERIEIYRLRLDGWSFRAIAASMGRAPSTVMRECKRNSRESKSWPGGYRPERADQLSKRRRQLDKRFKLARQPALRALVRDRLAMGWSPQQIAGRLALENAPMRISHESIYRFVYHRAAQKDYWNRLLPQRKGRRGRLKRGGISPAKAIKCRRSLQHRPQEAENRKQPGHWEADLMMFAKYGQVVLVAHERQSRLLIARRQRSKAAKPVANALCAILRPLPKPLRRTMTFDNGTEFALHYRLTQRLGLKTYFCDPYAPWQKGGVENAIRRLRRQLPRKSDLAKIPQRKLDQMIQIYNNTPRKCLGYKTPAEAFQSQLKTVALQP